MQEVLGGFPLSFAPLVKDWLEEALIELGHAPEGCSSEEEIEFLRLFVGLRLRNVFWGFR